MTADNIKGGLQRLSNHPQSIIFFDSGLTNPEDFMMNYSRYGISRSRMIVVPKGMDLNRFATRYRKSNPLPSLKK